jgi:short subunit dehydrogenase-like uncharacterized protein
MRAGVRWALAGRNRAKLQKLRSDLAATDAALGELPLLRADAEEPDSLREVVAATRVVITTVGPYIRYGEPLVAACAEAGTPSQRRASRRMSCRRARAR